MLEENNKEFSKGLALVKVESNQKESYIDEPNYTEDLLHETRAIHAVDYFDPSTILSLADIQRAVGLPFQDEPSVKAISEPADETIINLTAEMAEEVPVDPTEFLPERIVDKQSTFPQESQTGKQTSVRRLSDILFYVVIAFILVVTLVFGGKTQDGFQLFGYSGFTVLSGSMQREIPEGSLVITKIVDPVEIKVGDDITFVRDDNTTVTHRVINIIEDYKGSGGRGFQTQGLENPDPDRDVVHEGNVIGVVKHSIPELGYILSYVSENIGLVFLILGGILVATIALSKVLSRQDEKTEGIPEKIA